MSESSSFTTPRWSRSPQSNDYRRGYERKKYKTKEAHIDIRTIQQQDGAQFSICSINIYKKPIREEKKKEGEKDTKTEDTGENKPAEDTKEKTEENKPDKKQDNKEQEEKTEETKDGE